MFSIKISQQVSFVRINADLSKLGNVILVLASVPPRLKHSLIFYWWSKYRELQISWNFWEIKFVKSIVFSFTINFWTIFSENSSICSKIVSWISVKFPLNSLKFTLIFSVLFWQSVLKHSLKFFLTFSQIFFIFLKLNEKYFSNHHIV